MITAVPLPFSAALVVSQVFAYTPAIVDAQGQPLPNSIAIMETVTLNGCQQWITIRSKNVNQEKIYVMGESWGTVLGTLLVQQYPTLFYAYIGAGQRTSIHEDDVLGYEFALAEAARQGNTLLTENQGKVLYTKPPVTPSRKIGNVAAQIDLSLVKFFNLSVWRPHLPKDEPNGQFFATIGIGKAGYYSR